MKISISHRAPSGVIVDLEGVEVKCRSHSAGVSLSLSREQFLGLAVFLREAGRPYDQPAGDK